LIGAPAKQGVIDYGLEKVYDTISHSDSNSLSVVWDDCETVGASSKAEVAAAAVENRPDAPTFVPSTSSSPFPDGVETAFRAAVDAEFSAVAEKAGISVAVFTNDLLWTYASGIASSTAEMTPNTPLLIRSTSKTFLSALILDQAEQGLFELGDSLESVLSDHPDYPSLDTAIFNSAVSIHEMLSMRSGLAPRDPLASGASGVFSNPNWKPVDILKLVRGPWVEPGDFEYSDTNSVLLGLIAEHRGGKDLNILYQDSFFDPLGITAGLGPQDGFPLDTARPYSDLTLLAEQRNLNVSGFGDEIEASDYLTDPRDWYAGSTRLGWASAGVFTTAENMARWAYELYSPDGRAISVPNRTRLLNSVDAELVDFENRMQRYGYYISKSEVVLEDERVVTAYGHPGGGGNFVSKLAYSPELNIAVSVLTNSPMRFAGSCPDHSADESQRQGPQLCIVQEIFAAYAGG
jgi:D-alanyl-D-alanine carboxypeptidase